MHSVDDYTIKMIEREPGKWVCVIHGVLRDDEKPYISSSIGIVKAEIPAEVLLHTVE